MILVVDNYDSFTYNLVHYLAELGAPTHVVRNDDLTAAEAWALNPAAVLLSPGPCAPDQAGICLPLIESAPASMPILGVCLGHQAIGQAFGGDVIRAKTLMHGKTSPIHHDGKSVFAGLPSPFTATRYHSLRSWGSSTAAARSMACSSTRNPSPQNMATTCWPTSFRSPA